MPSFSRPTLHLVHDGATGFATEARIPEPRAAVEASLPAWDSAGWAPTPQWEATPEWESAEVWPETPASTAEPAGEEAWRMDALCAETDPEAFFPEKGGSTRDAKRVCTGCPVRAQCLEFALANDERFGIWGGLSERERRRLRQQRVGSISA
ncbi:transcription factor WhiB [Blastococcus saxobsidens]|uniref:Transcriptional regulator WhiB n=2 Tax=Blastococcus saxobsidens TaxID=138336 RepID=A0A4V2G257_9ACTN|nr:WhiB family transcriptional regulator [Blastococcus saxobsidens]RZU31836.1 transcription factor WhiB [Blastococcus saxobsidens]